MPLGRWSRTRRLTVNDWISGTLPSRSLPLAGFGQPLQEELSIVRDRVLLLVARHRDYVVAAGDEEVPSKYWQESVDHSYCQDLWIKIF